ncbi:hypothetical protein AKJ09_03452 [Labilithrix luteola]|uniref:Uncharacterized protein n=1 Tax=Labilithrix luteola TaxID=1391654 RepID=A0A0K1PTC6_9BACT|nr:tetratricopeptide repeat protein [Labilithrix luteola]AKU96788.1 hypothetical protein AKJ09_03452 [Labilithrix luteola]
MPRRPFSGLRAFVFAGLVAAIPVVVMLPGAASGQKAAPAKGADAGEKRYDPENVTGISESMETIAKGTERYLAKDFAGATDLYKRAIQLNPRNPLGPYLLGEAHLGMGNLGEAEAAFKQAESLSDSKNPTLRSHVLFAVADISERRKNWPAAKTAWQAYNEHAALIGVDGGAFPQSGAERLKMVETIAKLQEDYAKVRARIAAEKLDSGAPPAASSSSPAKKK